MANKYESREVKIKSKQERVKRMIEQLEKVARECAKKGGKLNDNLYLTTDGLILTRGAVKEYDTTEGDLYGYLNYGLMKSSLFLEKLPKDGPGKQKYLYRLRG